MPTFPCPYCNQPVFEQLTACPHCGRPSFYPNVNAAGKSTEVVELRRRYDAAIALAASNGTEPLLRNLEVLLTSSAASKALPRWEIDRLVSSDYAVAATYYQQIRGNSRIPDDNRWDRLRRIADAAFFQSYAADIHFAALSVSDTWLEHYGDGAVFFREEMIKHRATLFETNTACWVDANTGTLEVPPGHQAVWDDRHILGVAKLGQSLDAATSNLNALIMSCGASSADDNFIEVHILGGFTIRTAAKIVIRRKALSELSRESLNECAGRLNLEVAERA